MDNIIMAFQTMLMCDWEAKKEQTDILHKLVVHSKSHGYVISSNYELAFIEAINNKLNLNEKIYKHILDVAFIERIKLNYVQKNKIKEFLDNGDRTGYKTFLDENGFDIKPLDDAFNPVSIDETKAALSRIIDKDPQFDDVLDSIFSRYAFNLFERECTNSFFSAEDAGNYDFFDFIKNKYPDMCDRKHAMTFIDVDEELFSMGYVRGCNYVLNAIREAYSVMDNHCDMFIYIPPITSDEDNYQWRLYSDVILYSEKHIKERIDRAYFKWQKIASSTCEYINSIVPYNGEFDYAYQGFVFKDCFILNNDSGYSLLLVFEKNKRDERIVNCPACLSKNVQGNSYPILNVRSWECENPLCPDRSKYNRGKRYSFMSVYRQRQLQEPNNIIPEESIAKWHLDCLSSVTKSEALEMCIRHYSCWGDTIQYYTLDTKKCEDLFGRVIEYKEYSTPSDNLLESFKTETFFYRYIQNNKTTVKNFEKWEYGKSTVYHGDCFDVLRTMESDCIDGAVTSPPYYNAKSYSQWNNIYCYLYDMYNIAKEVYRTLKDGGVYLFNIFDYFDNENNVALSAMGNKRMILGAYMIDIFSRIGFSIVGNVIWNKGEIQGNRSFNQGNLAPYYQAPLNCWEHIIIVSKGKVDAKYEKLFSSVENIRPVIKIVKGKNILGHDAPFPIDIPKILLSCMETDDVILDPFLGSGTSSIAAMSMDIKSIGVEKNDDYFDLCKKHISNTV